jgi:hypothetical protein
VQISKTKGRGQNSCLFCFGFQMESQWECFRDGWIWLAGSPSCLRLSKVTRHHYFMTSNWFALTFGLLGPRAGLLRSGPMGQVRSVCSLIGLNIFETTFGVSNRIELLPWFAAMCGSSCFPCHVLSPFHLAVNGLALHWQSILFVKGCQ